MKVNIFKFIIIIILCAFVFTLHPLPFTLNVCYADVKIHPAAGTTSAAFLKLGLGSRPIAMGEAFCALANDISALYYNPAGLVQLEKREIQITHNESFENIKHDFFGYAQNYRQGILALAVYGLYMPSDFERRSGLNEDDPFEPFTGSEGSFGAHDLAIHASYAEKLNKNISAGVTAKIIQQTIDDTNAYGIAFDLGTLYKKSDKLSFGLALQHIGTPIKFRDTGYYPPFNIKLGTAWKPTGKLTTTLDLNKAIDNFLFINTGLEYIPIDFLQIRAGYKYRWYGQELDGFNGLSAGVGLNFQISDNAFRFDYAFTPQGVLGNSQRFSITTFFGSTTQTQKPPKYKKSKTTITSQANENLFVSSSTASLKTTTQTVLNNNKELNNYNTFNTTTTLRLRSSNGRINTYTIKTVCNDCDIYEISGLLNNSKPIDKINFQIIENISDNKNVYKAFSFNNSLKLNIQSPILTVRIPKRWSKISIKTNNEKDKLIKPEKTSEDNKYIHYKFKLINLQPFSIIGNAN